MFDVKNELPKAPLYREEFEHDACGIGACVNIHGEKTRETVENALKIVENLEHRAGKDAEGQTGDGVGILTQIPHKFFKRVTKALGIEIGNEREYGIGMFFFPQNELGRNQAKKMFEIIVEKEGLEFLGWREVPTFPNVLGHKAVECMPCIMQEVQRQEILWNALQHNQRAWQRPGFNSQDEAQVPVHSIYNCIMGIVLAYKLRNNTCLPEHRNA